MPSLNNGPQLTIDNNVIKAKVVPYREEHTSIGEFIYRKLGENPDSVGQIDVLTGKSYTYRTMKERSIRCALWLKSQGVGPRDAVAFCSHDHLDYPMAFFSIHYLGAVATPWDISLNEDDFRHRINITKPKIVFTSKDIATVVARAAKKARIEVKIVVFGHVPCFFEFEEILSESSIDEVDKFNCIPIDSSGKTALIVFSSGTTGPSKGVALSHKGLTMLMNQAEEIGMPGNVCLEFGTTGWLSSIEYMLMTLLLNMPRLILSTFEEHSVCATIEKYKVTWIYITPCMINKLLKSNAPRDYNLSSLVHVVHGGAMMPLETYKALETLLPEAEILSAYGITEACGFISIQSRASPLGSCGKIMKNVQLKVIDPDTGRSLGFDQKGEVLFKFACMMNGYHDNPKATSEIIDKDGWLHSGDFGYYDEDGELFVVDRLKDIIRVGDFDVSPSEIEGIIWSHPGVKEVAVVGQPRGQEDDLLIAFVVRKDSFLNTNEQETEREIMDLVVAELPKTSWLSGGVRFLDHIPKTPSNKIRRKALRDSVRFVA